MRSETALTRQRRLAAGTLAAHLLDNAGKRPTSEALVFPDARLNWRTLHEGATRYAAVLLALGLRKGDHVGILMPNGADWVQAFYGCAMIGAVTVPINTRFRSDELAYCLKQSDITVLLTVDRFLKIDYRDLLTEVEPAMAEMLPGSALPVLRHVLMSGEADDLPSGISSLTAALSSVTADDMAIRATGAQVTPSDLLLIQYTSGTTSFPKGVMLTHANMLQDATAVAQRMNVRTDDRYFSIRPFYHVAGTTLSLLVSLVSGCCLLSLPTFDVGQTLRMLDDERCTLTSGNDTIFLMLMSDPAFDRKRIHLRGGWAAAGPEVMQRIHDEMGAHGICNAYGQSEASPNVVFSAWDDPLELRVQGWMLPHEGVQIRTVGAHTGTLNPPGEPGEIQVRGWNVMRGYYRMPEATAAALIEDGWLRTGDLGVINTEGRLKMVGRLKDVFRVGGENVAPAEVEETLLAHPAVQLAQVVGVPDPRLGEVAAAFVVLRSKRVEGESGSACKGASDSATDVTQLTEWCRARCANFKVPRYLAIVDGFEEIGMTGSSKVQKNKLRAHAIERFGIAQVAGTPATGN